MGKVGILSAAATINDNVNVDVKGDVPTACNSPYIIGVTNTTIKDEKADGAGYGRINIDLGAPGTDIESTVPNDGLMLMSGTSMATPHVAGAVALAYSAASADLRALMLTDRAAAALEIKQLLLDTAHPLSDLRGRTVSGGRLDLGALVSGARQWAKAARLPAGR
jgi:serine protease